MSLLIKALQKAEQGKNSDDKSTASNQDPALELAPIEGAVKTGSPSDASLSNQTQNTRQAAAAVFSAKNNKTIRAGSNRPLILAGTGLLLVLLTGGGFYLYWNSLQQPVLIIAKPANFRPDIPAPVASQSQASTTPAELSVPAPEARAAEPVAQPPEVFAKPAATAAAKTKHDPAPPDEQAQAEPKIRTGRSRQLAFGELPQTNEDTTVKVTRNNPATGVNPALLSAYQAYNAGDDAAAQGLYRQVLQSDVRNVDALLGMAAIAARQNRGEDALGWYGKVLEVEPRNAVAQVALINVLAQTDPVGSESRIKNLLAQQPEAAYLHAALGNIYAEQRQWSQAQQAYFQAYHFDPGNAEYAFNLAVSLDQLGKSSLALQYYKSALELLAKSGTSHIDRAQLEARIGQLQ